MLRSTRYLLTAIIVCFPTVLFIVGIGMLGFKYDWSSWITYAGVMVLAVAQLGIKLLLSNFRDATLFERIFTFPKR